MTYNLHVMLRFDLELRPARGHARASRSARGVACRADGDLGITPPDDRDGCLQDVHWFAGGVGGAFQGYTLGNILSAQFYAAALRRTPTFPPRSRAGEFGTLHGWLRENIYRHGASSRRTNWSGARPASAMTMQPYLDYLRGKYGRHYALYEASRA